MPDVINKDANKTAKERFSNYTTTKSYLHTTKDTLNFMQKFLGNDGVQEKLGAIKHKQK